MANPGSSVPVVERPVALPEVGTITSRNDSRPLFIGPLFIAPSSSTAEDSIFTHANSGRTLLNTSSGEDEEMLLERPAAYLACGELKGGIDPAGADEHWKTAKTALSRIGNKLKRSCPPLFFVAAAIETAMARDIFRDLKKGFLTHAANLTDDRQVEDLASWLISL
jgi:hypothetical protein